MKMMEIDLHPDSRRLRQFGWIALAALGLLGVWARWRGHLVGVELGSAAPAVAWALWLAGAASGLFALVLPQANRPLYVALTLLTYPIGFVVSHVLLAVFFYLVITPVGLVFRAMGRDPLQRRFDRGASSYWVVHRSPENLNRYFKQF